MPKRGIDLSSYDTLVVDIKGLRGGESLAIGIKDTSQPDDGSEAKVRVDNLPSTWATYEFPLISFPFTDLHELWVLIEFVFDGTTPQDVFFRNVRYIDEP